MTPRRTALVVLLAGFLALGLASPAAAREVKISASLVIATKTFQIPCARCGPGGTPTTYENCAYMVVAQIAPVAGATSYRVVVKDGGGDRTVTPTSNVYNDYAIPTPAGVLWAGLTAGNGPPPCPAEPTLGGRFKILSATAGLACPSTDGRTSGSPTRAPGATIGLDRTPLGSALASQLQPVGFGEGNRTYCVPFTKEQIKKRAQENADWWTDQAWDYAAWGVFGGGGLSLISGPAGVVFGMAMGALNLYATDQATQQGKIARDPPDRRWRVLARAPSTFPNRLQLPRGLSAQQARAVRAYLGAQLRGAALAQCLGAAIDRGTTAFAKRNVPKGVAQYRAGAKCANQGAKLGAGMPRLAGPVVALLAPSDAAMMQLAGQRTSAPGTRNGQYASLGRAIGLSRAKVAALEAKAQRAAKSPKARLTRAPSVRIAESATQAAEDGQVLSATARLLTTAANRRKSL